MLKKIKKIEGSKRLSKKQQQNVNGGNFEGYTCPTGLYLTFEACDDGHYLHPQGHCICCSIRWVKA